MANTLAVRSAAWVTRRFHNLPGRWRLVRWLDQQRDVLDTLTPQTIEMYDGYRMRVNPRDENGRRVFVHGYEKTERLTRHFIRILRPGDCALDIGANVGYYTIVAAKAVGPTGAVHAFEASPEMLPWLTTNAGLNPVARIAVHATAVADTCGELEFHTAPVERSGYSSLRPLDGGATRSVRVPALSIDSLLDELPGVRLVKIDVEGAEMRVLAGMAGLLERDKPFVITEIDDKFLRELGSSAKQMCDFFCDRGYHLHQVVERGDLRAVEEPPMQRCNLLACPPGPEGLALSRP